MSKPLLEVGPLGIMVTVGQPPRRFFVKADLVAAAPELLEALEWLTDGDSDPSQEEWEELGALVAKAKGQE